MIRDLRIAVSMIIVAACTMLSCHREKQMVSSDDGAYHLCRLQSLTLHGSRDCVWHIVADGVDSTYISAEFTFCTDREGKYIVTATESEDDEEQYEIVVEREQKPYSPYIAKVNEYMPAPGQFVGLLPAYEDGDTQSSMNEKATAAISGKSAAIITLGACGGYVTFSFDHSIINRADAADFAVYGNAFYSSPSQGSAEPGVVMVCIDANNNNLPDDEWYELAGSDYDLPTTIHNYEVTYLRPAVDHLPTPKEDSPLVDTTYIKWRDNVGADGYITMNLYHTQPYYPQWIKADEVKYKVSSRLAPNAEDVSGDGSSFVLAAPAWGYVDSHPDDETELNAFDIDWAVDASGRRVHLPCVDFVRVCTAINQQCGRIGETSTEVKYAEDLNLK